MRSYRMSHAGPPSVCIVTPGYIASTPRVVKEADALKGAGFDVRVVFSQGNLERVRVHDEELLAGRGWRWAAVGWSPGRKGEKFLYYKSGIRQRAASAAPHIVAGVGRITEDAEGRVYRELAALAAKERADLYIGHYPAGLAAAAFAAKRWGARLGYDVEDLHTGEPPPTREGRRQTERIRRIESRYLPLCSHVSAVSAPVAEEMGRRYSIEPPLVVHNVFTLAERGRLDGRVKDRRDMSVPSLYWYSQTIGEERGIEDAIRAAGLLGRKVEIHLRGSSTEAVRRRFKSLASQCGVGDQLYFHSPVPPGELLSRASEHDVGLALEQPVNASRMLAVTNKLFFYLLAGLAVAATDVPGQLRVMSECAGAGLTYPAGDHRALADRVEEMVSAPERLAACKRAALEAARTRWNWEREQRALVERVNGLLGRAR